MSFSYSRFESYQRFCCEYMEKSNRLSSNCVTPILSHSTINLKYKGNDVPVLTGQLSVGCRAPLKFGAM